MSIKNSTSQRTKPVEKKDIPYSSVKNTNSNDEILDRSKQNKPPTQQTKLSRDSQVLAHCKIEGRNLRLTG